MKLYKIRAYSPQDQEEFIVQMTIDGMVQNPYNLNMADVGLILLNEMRSLRGLEVIPEAAVAGSLEDLKSREQA